MKQQNTLRAAIIALLTLTLPLTMTAQTKVWSIGPEAGVTISKYGNDAGANDFKAGAVTGLFVTYSIINTFGITTKILYNERGALLSDNTKQTLQYIEIPVIGRFFLNREGNVRPNIYFGHRSHFLLGSETGLVTMLSKLILTRTPFIMLILD